MVLLTKQNQLSQAWQFKALFLSCNSFCLQLWKLMTPGCDCEDDPLTLTCTKAVICTSLCCRFNSHPGFSVRSSPDLCWCIFVRVPAVIPVYLTYADRHSVSSQNTGDWGRKGMKERKKENVLIRRHVMFVSSVCDGSCVYVHFTCLCCDSCHCSPFMFTMTRPLMTHTPSNTLRCVFKRLFLHTFLSLPLPALNILLHWFLIRE